MNDNLKRTPKASARWFMRHFWGVSAAFDKSYYKGLSAPPGRRHGGGAGGGLGAAAARSGAAKAPPAGSPVGRSPASKAM